MNDSPVGIFDSGLGGLTVVREIHKLLPSENLIYLGDSKRAPYGTKSKETIINFAFQDVRFLIEKGVKAIVIACNTVSSNAINELKAEFDLPFVEVIRPGSIAGIEAAVNKKIGVIGTRATIESGAYLKQLKAIDKDTEVIQKCCPLFVPIVEEGSHLWDSEVADIIAEMYLDELKQKNLDAVILGCTHYPLLKKTIQKALGPDVILINSARNAALHLSELLEQNLRNKSSREGVIELYTSDSVDRFLPLGKEILGMENLKAERIDIEKYKKDI